MSNDHVSKLYEFQARDVNYLVEHGGGGVWHDPGLGKTRIAIVAAKGLGGPILVICPNMLKQWWKQEILEMYPKSSITIAGTGGRFGSRNVLQLPDNPIPFWTIIHYTGVRLNQDNLRRVPWKTVICDEAHYIKNRKAARSKAVMDVTPGYAYRLALTATPCGNNVADIWHQLRWIAPYVDGLRSYWRFYETFVNYEYVRRGDQKYREVRGAKNVELLGKVMAAYGIRHSKKQVAAHLPPITDTFVPLEMTPDQAKLYGTLKRKAAVEVTFPADPGERPTRLVIANTLVRLLRLEQWLSHPWTFVKGMKGAKLQWLLEWAEGCKHQTVIATRFKASAYEIAKIFKSDKRCRYAITGDLSVGARMEIIEDWKGGNQQFLVGTIGTIGTGLSFENAHSMICYDQLHSTIQMDQVRQRIHRITSDHPVEVIYPYCQGTTNEVILEAFTKQYKQLQLLRRFIEHLRQENGE